MSRVGKCGHFSIGPVIEGYCSACYGKARDRQLKANTRVGITFIVVFVAFLIAWGIWGL